MNSVREIDMKNRMYCLLDDIINIKNLNLIRSSETKNHTKIFLFTALVMQLQIGIKALYNIINKINGYTEEHNGNKYLTQVQIDKSKDTLQSMKTKEKN